MPGSRFDRLSERIKKEYLAKGYTEEEATRIGAATAAKIGREKYGKEGMEKKAEHGRD